MTSFKVCPQCSTLPLSLPLLLSLSPPVFVTAAYHLYPCVFVCARAYDCVCVCECVCAGGAGQAAATDHTGAFLPQFGGARVEDQEMGEERESRGVETCEKGACVREDTSKYSTGHCGHSQRSKGGGEGRVTSIGGIAHLYRAALSLLLVRRPLLLAATGVKDTEAGREEEREGGRDLRRKIAKAYDSAAKPLMALTTLPSLSLLSLSPSLPLNLPVCRSLVSLPPPVSDERELVGILSSPLGDENEEGCGEAMEVVCCYAHSPSTYVTLEEVLDARACAAAAPNPPDAAAARDARGGAGDGGAAVAGDDGRGGMR